MTVTVVMPCFREPIAEVERSLASALAVPAGASVIIVDDGAGQSELDGLASDRVTVLHREVNGGPSAALNDGIAAAPADSVICRLDVRDEFYPEPKARQIETVLRGVRASCSPHFDPVAGKVYMPPQNWRTRMFTDSCFTGISLAFQRNVWERVGIDVTYRWAEDWRFNLMIEHLVGFDMFPEVTCSAGMFPGGYSDCTDNRDKWRRRDADLVRVSELGQALLNPDAYAHLYNPKWCQKRGRVPLPARRKKP